MTMNCQYYYYSCYLDRGQLYTFRFLLLLLFTFKCNNNDNQSSRNLKVNDSLRKSLSYPILKRRYKRDKTCYSFRTKLNVYVCLRRQHTWEVEELRSPTLECRSYEGFHKEVTYFKERNLYSLPCVFTLTGSYK